MEDFYTRVMGFTVTDRGVLETDAGPLSLVFLSRDPREHHQIVLASGRPAKLEFNAINQISFRVPDLAALRDMHRRLQGEAVTHVAPIWHGNALSVYFRDPEGNRLEVFLDTPWYVPQPHGHPLDLEISDEEIRRRTETRCRQDPGFMTVGDWQEKMRAKMGPG